MKKVLVLLMVLSVTLVSAQDGSQDAKSKEILGELSKKAKTYKSITASYKQTYRSSKGASSVSSGKIWVKDQKFKFTSSEGQDITSDGKTVWTYVKDDQIVYVCPVEDALEGEDFSNPNELFTIWEKDFKSRYVKDETVGGKEYQIIYLSPMKPAEKKFHTIVLKVDKAAKQLYKLIIKSNDGSTTIYQLNNFKANPELSDGLFKWKSKPGVDEEEC